MVNTPAEVGEMLPITEDWLRDVGGWQDIDFQTFDQDSTKKKAEFLALDILNIGTDVNFDWGPDGPQSEDDCVEWAVESLWDGLGWDMYENPKFVRFNEHPEWDDDTINLHIKEILETRFEESGSDWWHNNADESYL